MEAARRASSACILKNLPGRQLPPRRSISSACGMHLHAPDSVAQAKTKEAPKALLANKVAIVTGAASTLGKAIATKFVMHGARVILTDFDNNYESCVDTANELKKKETLDPSKLGLADAMRCDVTNHDNISEVIRQVKKSYSHLDIFYNNAGINVKNFKKSMEVNVESVLASIKHASAEMASNDPKGGCILCTGSTTGVLGDVLPSPYSISKAALVGMIRAAAAELEDRGVRVDKMIEKYVTNRVVTVEDVANAAVYLASDASKGVTGHNFVLNGKFPLLS